MASKILHSLHNLLYDFSKKFRSEETLKDLSLLENSYKSLKVVGRGGTTVNIKEVVEDESTKELFNKVKEIVRKDSVKTYTAY